MKKLLLFISAISFSLLVSCEEDVSATDEAVLVTASKILNDPGYAELRIEYDDYTPDPTDVQFIKDNFDPGESIVIYVEPSCGCEGTKKAFPQLLKTIDEAELPDENVQIFSMHSEGSGHPHNAKLTIRDLPEFHLMRDGEFVYSILDSLESDQAATPNRRIENWLAKALADK